MSLLPNLTAAASQAAFVPSSYLSVAELHNSLLTYVFMLDVEHSFIALRQKRPLSELHIFVPQTQVTELAERPSVLEQAEMAEGEHWLYVLLQNIPLTELQAPVVPQDRSNRHPC